MPHFANPYLDDLPENELQWGAVCGLYGERRDFSSLRGRINTADIRDWDEVEIRDDDREHDPHANDPEIRRLWILLLRRLTILRYKRAGKLTDIQVRTLYLAWIEELGLREIARSEKKKHGTISHRIDGTKGYGGLARRVPEFGRWWSARHASRKGRGQEREKGFNK